jgi:hypothetical protein
MTVTNSIQPRPGQVEFKNRAALLLAAYGVTLLLLIQYLEAFILFPWGLFYLLPFLEIANDVILAVIGWTIYLVLTLLVLFSGRRSAFTAFYLILVLLLILNVAGCSVMQHDLAVAFPDL